MEGVVGLIVTSFTGGLGHMEGIMESEEYQWTFRPKFGAQCKKTRFETKGH